MFNFIKNLFKEEEKPKEINNMPPVSAELKEMVSSAIETSMMLQAEVGQLSDRIEGLEKALDAVRRAISKQGKDRRTSDSLVSTLSNEFQGVRRDVETLKNQVQNVATRGVTPGTQAYGRDI